MRRHLVIILALLACSATFAQFIKHPLKGPSSLHQIYDPNANARAEIKAGIAEAAKDHKRVLLVFGGNWCFDCHVLDNALRSPEIKPLFDPNYLLVHVDVGEMNKNLDIAEQYKVNLSRGVPALAVLDARGKLLYSDQNGEFEKARRMTQEDVTAFLNRWKPGKS